MRKSKGRRGENEGGMVEGQTEMSTICGHEKMSRNGFKF